MAAPDQGRQFLAEHRRRRIADDEVEGVVDHRLALGAPVVVGDRGRHRAAPVLHAEGHDGCGAAEGRADAARAEAVRHRGALGGEAGRLWLVEVAMGVDAAGQHQPSPGVDGAGAARQALGDRHDAASDDADVGPHHVGGRRYRAAADDEVERHVGSLRRSAEGRKAGSKTSSGFGVVGRA